MRIAIDGRTIVSGKTGVGVYAERVVRSLLEVDQHNEYFLFLVEPADNLQGPNLTKVSIEGYNRMGRNRLWENILLPGFAARHSIDVFFSPAYALPILPSVYRRRDKVSKPRYVVTIHDLIGLLHPETFTRKMHLWQKLFVANAARHADAIITGSQAAKMDFLKLHPIEERRITVIPHSVDEDFRLISDSHRLEKVKQTYRLPDRILLYVGTVEPRKNIAALARAFAMLPTHVRDEFTLVIAGRPGWYVESIYAEVARLRLAEKIRFLGYISRNDLPSLYNLATVFGYPSMHEGFGFPPLEAMSCGVPVLCSNTSSFPEVVGDAAIMVDPTDVEELSKQLGRLLVDASLRSELRSRGLARARLFSARRTAEQTLEVLKNAAMIR